MQKCTINLGNYIIHDFIDFIVVFILNQWVKRILGFLMYIFRDNSTFENVMKCRMIHYSLEKLS